MNKEDIIEYFEVLYDVNRPLYLWEIPEAKKRLEEVENKINGKKFLIDIKDLYDKDICRIYKLEPRNIHPKYANKTIKDLKREKIDFLKMRMNAERQFQQI